MTADEDNGDLYDIIGAAPYEDMRAFDSRLYSVWEREVATPALEALGYKVLSWETTDGDSFGPLVRTVTVEKGGNRMRLDHA
jgi:hypothetical protein